MNPKTRSMITKSHMLALMDGKKSRCPSGKTIMTPTVRTSCDFLKKTQAEQYNDKPQGACDSKYMSDMERNGI